MCNPPDDESDDISEANYQTSFAVSVVEDLENNKITQLLMLPIKKIEVQDETAYSGQNNKFTISGSGILCETTSLLVIKHHRFHGSKSEKYLV